MAKTKRDKYRELLEKVFRQITRNSNADDWECGNCTSLVIYNPWKIYEYMKRFEEIKRG
jgi:hypothetical protein